MRNRNAMRPAVREWLRNERRLGIEHYVIPQQSTVPTERAAGARAAPEARRASPKTSVQGPTSSSRPVTATFLPDDPTLPPPCERELPAAQAKAALEALDATAVRGCKKCRLHEHRTQTVFGVGHPRPQLAFVGEGPGADEDAQGEPFVGRAGQLLTRMIAAMTLTRDQVYICNVVKCRPPGNRTPSDDEMEMCSPYLWRQLAILRPQIIVALGRPAAQTLLATKTPIGKLRGRFYDFPPVELSHVGLPPTKVLPTFHPAYLLRNPPAKSEAWEDLKQVMQFLGLKIPRRGQ